MDRDRVLAWRLATQRLTGPAAADPVQVVRELLSVQAQDAMLARAMIALRCDGTEADVRAAVNSGALIRTHILRPTWHYVAAEDLRWLLALTSPRVLSGLAGRHRQLGLDELAIGRGLDVLGERLAGRRFAIRRDLATGLAEAGVLVSGQPLFGSQVGHLLLIAELRGLICSGPMAGREHAYALVKEWVPALDGRSREDALVELVGRFNAGHGPVALPDLVRWTRLTQAELRSALDAVGSAVTTVEVDGEELWFAPDSELPETRPAAAHLLSTFDEAFLSYRRVGFPRSSGHPAGSNPYRFAEAGGGVVISHLQDVGAWKRTVRGRVGSISLDLDSTLPSGDLDGVRAARERLEAAIRPPTRADVIRL